RRVVERELPRQPDVLGAAGREYGLVALPGGTLRAAAVGQPVRARRGPDRIGTLQADVPELDLHGRAGVQLQAEQAVSGPPLVVVHEQTGHVAVHDFEEDVAAGHDLQLVPIPLFHERFHHIGLGQRPEQLHLAVAGDARRLARSREKPAAPLFVDLTGVDVRRIDIGLVALHDPAPGVRAEAAPHLDDAVAGRGAGAHAVIA